jgi:superfamily II DNA or RNA helicase
VFGLRYYQQEAVDAVRRVWETHQAAVVIAATGTGKTELYLSLAVSEPGRVLVIVHRDYLITQPIRRLVEHGFEDVAVEKAVQKSEGMLHKAKVVFASIQSLSKDNRLATFNPHDFSIVIIDEGHRAVAPTYRKVVDHFRRNPRVRFLILTATPKRKDNIALGNLCDGDICVAYTYGPKQAANEGWLVPLRFYRREVEGLDFSRVALKGSDLDQEQVERLLMQEKPLHIVCASLAEDRGPTIIFCPGVMIARAYSTLVNERYRPGRAAVLWANSLDEERELVTKRLCNGDLEYVFNVDLFTEGYDVPELARVVWAAPTASLVRFTQGTGRVFRAHSSVAKLLTGPRAEAEARRLLIEESVKPCGHVVTYYPQNCKHQLCEPNDILGGDELPPELRAVAKQIQEETAAQPGGSAPDEDVETAKALIQLRQLLDERRRDFKAKADVNDVQYDGFGGSRNRAVGEGTGSVRKSVEDVVADWPASDNMISPKFLGWYRAQDIAEPEKYKMTAWRAYVVRQLMDLGVSFDTAIRYGRKQALAVLDKLQTRSKAS